VSKKNITSTPAWRRRTCATFAFDTEGTETQRNAEESGGLRSTNFTDANTCRTPQTVCGGDSASIRIIATDFVYTL
jgi:hypothetical protein